MSNITGLSAKQMVYQAKIYYESIASNDAPGFSSREWSVILTNAQDKLVYEVYRTGIDNDEEGRVLIGALLTPYESKSFKSGIYPNSFIVELPKDYMYLYSDRCDTKLNTDVQVMSMSLDSYFANRSNPYKKPNKNRVWKVLGTTAANRLIITDGTELVAYKAQYIKKPTPIVVEDLVVGKGIEYINGVEWTKASDCILHPNAHRKIVEIAARDAYIATAQK